jgi:two-component system cell cycle sensor histidine kinase/response regulator CckA
VVAIDISEQKRLEQQFIQSQKMQAVGQLAGGIAHDFNNLLTAMIGFCDLLLQRHLPNDPAYTDIVQIKQNANRAANLVRQLLAFSRQQTLQPRVIHISDVLGELSSLLRRLIGANIELKLTHERDLWPVKVDPGQLEQVIINLIVNARDAMPQGGVLILRTGHYQPKRQQRLGHDVMPPGDYVLIEVSDTGCGIERRDIDHIFEPFFSTKELGSGTGLGLSTVFLVILALKHRKFPKLILYPVTYRGKRQFFWLRMKRPFGLLVPAPCVKRGIGLWRPTVAKWRLKLLVKEPYFIC